MNYKTSGVCSTNIYFEIDEQGLIRNVEFTAGCNGNGKGVAALVSGRSPAEVINIIDGIKCNRRETSCPDQLSKALQSYLAANANP